MKAILIVVGLFVTALGVKSSFVQEPKQGAAVKSSDSGTVEALIKKMEEERIQAGVHKDVAAIAAVTSDDYVMIDFDGKVQTKKMTLERIKSSEIQLKSNSLDEIKVRVYGDTAVVTGRATPNGTINGEDFSRAIRYTRVYIKSAGQWRVVSFQQTRVAGAATTTK